MLCHSLLQWTTFCQTSPLWPSCLGWARTAWLSFIELDKAVVCVIRLASFLWLWFQSVCPLMPSHNAYCLTWVSLTLHMGYLLTTSPELGRGVTPLGCHSWPWMWGSFSRLLLAAQRPWCWERLRAGEGDDRGWDSWTASLTQWTWVWVNSRSWWWTGRPGMLWFMGSQRVGHDWATELNW